MLLPFEIIHRSAVPTIRYMVASKLIKEYNMTQNEAANILGVTQAAISNYYRRTRATVINFSDNKDICNFINELTVLLLKGNSNRPEVVEKIVEICDYLRKEKLLCNFHKKMEPLYNSNECNACQNPFII